MPSGPTLRRERLAWADRRLLVGVDEAGRGPLAGPVVAAAVVFPEGARPIRGVRDSKLVPLEKRDRLAAQIRTRAWCLGVGAASCREIDRVNIRVATALAMRRAVAALLRVMARRLPAEAAPSYLIIIDGLPVPELGYPHDALVDGDALCYSVAAASLVAKTVRDRLMRGLAARYPAYGWHTNVGYGTPDHLAGLAAAGPTRHHRMSFAPCLQRQLWSEGFAPDDAGNRSLNRGA